LSKEGREWRLRFRGAESSAVKAEIYGHLDSLLGPPRKEKDAKNIQEMALEGLLKAASRVFLQVPDFHDSLARMSADPTETHIDGTNAHQAHFHTDETSQATRFQEQVDKLTLENQQLRELLIQERNSRTLAANEAVNEAQAIQKLLANDKDGLLHFPNNPVLLPSPRTTSEEPSEAADIASLIALVDQQVSLFKQK
jgi:hypothetical protein